MASNKYTVTVLGACGGIGQPLCLLLKSQGSLIGQLNLYDVVDPAGVAEDLSHIPTSSAVKAFPSDQLESALDGSDIVVIPAGVPRKPNMTRDDLFNINAGIVKKLIEAVAEVCPRAVIALITNPVNSMVPLASNVLSSRGVDYANKLIGVTTLDLLRTETFSAPYLGVPPEDITGVCICGHSGTTIVPLLPAGVDTGVCEKIQNAGTAVVNAKKGAGSATLSMALAGFRTVKSILDGLSGQLDVVECAFVSSTLTTAKFFASQVVFGKSGVEAVLPLPELTPFQQNMLNEALPTLLKEIQKGLDFPI